MLTKSVQDLLPPREASIRRRAATKDRSPRDVPFATVAGADPDRVLLIGPGPALGHGVETHDLALPGQLARRLSVVTGRGAHVAALPSSPEDLGELADALASQVLFNWDVVVITLGDADATRLRSVRSFEFQLARLLTTVLQRAHPAARVVVTSAPLDDAVRAIGARRAARVTTRGGELDGIVRRVCEQRRQVTHLELPDRHAAPGSSSSAAARFGVWAGVMAGDIAPLLADQRARKGSPQAARREPQPAVVRLAAIFDLDMLGRAPDEAIRLIAERARARFDTHGVSVNLLLDDRQHTYVGTQGAGSELPISESFCAQVVRSGTPLIVSDDAWTRQDVPRTDVRFYAGYPIQTEDGVRIGTVCVWDHQPRVGEVISAEALQGFALEIERELHHRATRPARALTH